MCGIAGIISKNQITDKDLADVTQMTELIAHRGPDGSGFFDDGHIALGMRRLSIIDTSGSHQPLWNEDKTIVLIFNGEIYNYIELQKDLEGKGHKFNTHGDGETIIHAYEEYGDEFLNHLRGMFAFCLYDLKNQRAVIARDRLGEKPLYLYEDRERVVFSSEMKSILTMIPESERHINLDALNLYFHYQYVPEPLTLLNGIRKLTAGSLITVNLNNFAKEEKSYWDLDNIQPIDREPIKATRDTLNEIEKIIIRSDVPVGISLSGGLDSTIIASLSAKFSSKKLHAFSVGYPGRPENDERDQAKKIASDLELIFHEIEIDPQTVAQEFDEMIYDLDDPIADIASYGYSAVAQKAKQENVPVLLSGIGSDELFWGYSWMIKAAEINRLKEKGSIYGLKILYILLKHWKRELRKSPWKVFRLLFRRAFSSDYIFYELTPGFFMTQRNHKEIFTSNFLSKINNKLAIKLFNKKGDLTSDLQLCILLQKSWLLSNCLPIGDRLSMAHSVELRMPFLDYKLFQTVLGMRIHNPDFKLGSKHWLKEATKELVPNEVLNRKKRGFTPPTLAWIQEIITKHREHLVNGLLVRSGIIQEKFVRNALNNIKENRDFLYKLAVVEVWLNKFKVHSI